MRDALDRPSPARCDDDGALRRAELASARRIITLPLFSRARRIRWSCLGIPLPMALAPRSRAREWQEDGHFRFDVPIALPLVGLIVQYTGWLGPDR